MIAAKHRFEFFYEFRHFLIIFLIVGSYLLLVGFNCGLHDDETFIRLVIRIVDSFWNLKY